MKLENQVCNLELSKKLKELGVKQHGLYVWVESVVGTWNIELEKDSVLPVFAESFCSAFTVAELGEMLPFQIKFNKHVCYLSCAKNIPDYGGWYCFYESSDIIRPTYKTKIFTADTEADARAKMLIYLLENKLTNREPA